MKKLIIIIFSIFLITSISSGTFITKTNQKTKEINNYLKSEIPDFKSLKKINIDQNQSTTTIKYKNQNDVIQSKTFNMRDIPKNYQESITLINKTKMIAIGLSIVSSILALILPIYYGLKRVIL